MIAVAKWTYINDRFIEEENALIHFRDLSVQRGYGIFDFLKFINYQPLFLDDHLNRFYSSAREMRLPVMERAELIEVIKQLIQKNNQPEGGIRITLTGGYSSDGYQLAQPNLIISYHRFQPPTSDQFEKGIALMTYQHQRQLPHVKTIDYLMAIWLQPLIKKNNADDVLYHKDGVVSECPRSNFFIVTKDDTIITPGRNILKGVSRMKLMEIARDHFEIIERDVTVDDIKNAKEAFISSTTKLILPVNRIDEQMFNPSKPVTAKLFKALNFFKTQYSL